MLPIKTEHIAGSFRDPSGRIIISNGEIRREICTSYKENFDQLISSGLHDQLVKENLLVAHREISLPPPAHLDLYKMIAPTPIPFISYPQEWSFSQIKDAALTTLKITEYALNKGMILKDASAYNIQFLKGSPILIDTLSFETYEDGKPWQAYKQFCQHFVAPLSLMSTSDVRLGKLALIFIDGIPLDLAAKLLPWKTKLSPRLLLHIHAHARAQKTYADKAEKVSKEIKSACVSKNALRGLLDSLRLTIEGLKWNPKGTEWGNYYNETNYSENSFSKKEEIVNGFLKQISPKTVWDFGANAGEFSKIAALIAENVISFDVDYAAVEKNYILHTKKSFKNILPLVLDLTNPTPSYGWANRERMSLKDRGTPDVVMALALVHHMAIGNNIPLAELACFMSECAPYLIIEFVPKEDSQVQRMLASREDIFHDYNQSTFEKIFSQRFLIQGKSDVPGTKRSLYLMRRHEENYVAS
ncbi:MAG: SAM-dependent methyltransferase [bacterium]|nr:SAM-dependent methyltransferase [bacterium]